MWSLWRSGGGRGFLRRGAPRGQLARLATSTLSDKERGHGGRAAMWQIGLNFPNDFALALPRRAILAFRSGFVTSFPCAQNLRDSTHKVREADDFSGHVAEQASSSKLAHANEPALVRLSHAVVRDPQQR
jgi:hypothetical protein